MSPDAKPAPDPNACKRDRRGSWCVTHACKWPRGYGECLCKGRW